MSTKSVRRTRRSGPPWIVPVVVLSLAVIMIVAIAVMNQTDPPEDADGASAPSTTQEPDLIDVEARDDQDRLAAGPVDAPVVLVVFSDYQCGFCAKWSADTLPAMMEQVEAGNLRIEWRDVNVFGAVSQRAARASYAAALQGSFWEYHGALFAGGEKRSEADLSEDALIAMAGELGLDTEQFATDFAAPETAEVIAENQQLGVGIGVNTTPTFVMAGRPIFGAQPTDVFESALQAALDAAG